MDAWFSPLTTQTLAPHPLASRRKQLSGPYPGAPAGAAFLEKNSCFFSKNSCPVLSVTDLDCVVGNLSLDCVVGNLTVRHQKNIVPWRGAGLSPHVVALALFTIKP